jgi:3-oxoacyl-[acyl-carrier-protein] synthase II
MTALVAASAVRTCLGGSEATLTRLVRGDSQISGLDDLRTPTMNIERAYRIREKGPERSLRASGWLRECVEEVIRRAGVDSARERVVAIVGTGLGEMREVERAAVEGRPLQPERLHFAHAVREAAPGVHEVITLSNACSASGHALALAQDLVELGDADVVVAAGADSMTASMLAMIGRISPSPPDHVRPFDVDRRGVLLGDGAAALVVVAEGACERPLARVLATGLSCDAHHATAPDLDGLRRAVRSAYQRARRLPSDVDLVIAHGTGTALGDPIEATLLAETFGEAREGPLVTAVKGAVGHTSGAAALLNVHVAIGCVQDGVVPPIAGLDRPVPEAHALRLVVSEAVRARVRVAQVNAFGFGGVNAVTLIEAAG